MTIVRSVSLFGRSLRRTNKVVEPGYSEELYRARRLSGIFQAGKFKKVEVATENSVVITPGWWSQDRGLYFTLLERDQTQHLVGPEINSVAKGPLKLNGTRTVLKYRP